METNHIKQKLEVPLPPEAVSPHPTKVYLSTIKHIYVTERFNEVFGVGGWQLETELIHWFSTTKSNGKVDYTSLVKTTFLAPEHNIKLECFGGSTNDDLGDAVKGGTSDAITKIGSWLGVGIDVFKGKHDKKTTPKNETKKPKKEEPKKEELTPSHKTWAYAVKRVADGVATIKQIEAVFRISEENKKKLQDEAKQPVPTA